MRRRVIFLKLMSVLALFGLLIPQPAYAYLDPGTGSYILQLVLGAMVGMLFALKIFWKNIRTFVGNFLSRERKAEEDHDLQ
jgi:hypothetical protein